MNPDTTAPDPVLPDARMNLVPVSAPVTGRVVSNDPCLAGKSASFVRHTVIDVSGTPLAGSFLAGQSFGVIAPGEDEHGKPHKVRLYSIACPRWGDDGEGNLLCTTTKRLLEERKPQRDGDDPDDHRLFVGVCSNYLCDLSPGAEVRVTGPNGKRFLLPARPEDHDYVFIGAGTGIAPFRGMVQELLEGPGGPVASRIDLVMGAPYTTDLLYDDLFRRCAEEHEQFHYHTAISRERRPDGRRGRYVHHLIDECMDEFGPLLSSPRTLIYICGLLGMQSGLFQVMARHGVGDAYMTVKDPLTGVDPADWPADEMKRAVRPTKRCMVELY